MGVVGMKIFNFLKRQPQAKQEGPPAHQPPRLVFEIYDDGRILIACSWPTPKSEEEAKFIISNYSALLYLINSGKFLSGLQHTIASFNDNTGNSEVNKAILFYLEQLLEKDKPANAPANDKPVVPPSKAFAVRSNQP